MKGRERSEPTRGEESVDPSSRVGSLTLGGTVATALQKVQAGQTFEAAYNELSTTAHRKKLGQFFTPPAVARFMLQWAITPSTKTLLDPATGMGIFPAQLPLLVGGSSTPDYTLDLYDIDSIMLELTKHRLTGLNIAANYQLADFLTEPPQNYYDACVCNPPYIRHHDMHYPESLWQHFDTDFDLHLSRNTNAYCLFILQISRRLSTNGRAAIITPSEFLNADYGKEIKRYLLRENLLEGIIQFDSKTLVFDNAITTACIILLQKAKTDDKVTFWHVPPQTDLDLATLPKQTFIHPELNPSAKWGALFSPPLDRGNPPCLSGSSASPQTLPLVALSSIATSMRGIATGANRFFALSKAEVAYYGIEPDYLKPCVTKARQIQHYDYTPADFSTLEQADKKIYLLVITEGQTISDNLQKYLQLGTQNGLHQRYLTSHRPCWYVGERRPPAPILVNVFARGDFKVAYNRARVLNLTAYHCLYPRFEAENQIKALAAYLISPPARHSIQYHKRTYGDGLDKLEPHDLNPVLVPDIPNLPPAFVATIAHAFDTLCLASRQDPTAATTLKQELDQLWH